MSLTFTLLTAPLAAQEPSPAELARRVDALAQQVDAMRQGSDAPLAPARSSSGLAPAASRVYRGSLGEVSLGGYGEISYSDPAGGAPEWDLYRLVVYLGVRFNERWLFNSEIEYEHGDELGIEFAYLEGQLTEALALRVGHLLVPMGLVNEIHEPTTFPSAFRPSVERLILPTTWHENGIGLVGAWGDFSARAYVMNGFDSSGFDLATSGLRGGRQSGSEANAEDLALVGRVDWEGVPGLLLGAAAYQGDSGQGTGPDFFTSVLDLHAQYSWRALRVRGLWADATVDDAALLPTPSASNSLSGAYLEAGWDLLAGDPAGRALIPFLRWEDFDLAEDAPGDTGVTALTLGVAFHPVTQIAFKLDWTDFDDPSGAFADVFACTAGFAF